MTAQNFGVVSLLDYLSAIELEDLPEPSEAQREAVRLLLSGSRNVSARNLLPALPSQKGELPAARLLLILAALPQRDRWILAERLLRKKSSTLQELGDKLGLTRERVRQLEDRCARRLRVAIDKPRATHLKSAINLLNGAFPDNAYSLSVLTDAIDEYLEVPRGLSLPEEAAAHVRLILGFTEVDSDYAFRISRKQLWSRIADSLSLGIKEADESNRLIEVGRMFLVPVAFVQDVRDSLDLRVTNGVLLPWNGSLADKAERVLVNAGEPLSFEEICKSLGIPGSSESSLRNYLISDLRFKRVARSRYALTVWGLEEYSTIRDLIRRRIAQNGGKILLSALLSELPRRFDVTESSVRTYASGAGFRVDRWGFVSEATAAGDGNTIKALPSRNRFLFRRGSSWYLRMAVNSDVFRGSGRLIPVAAAAEMGLVSGRAAERLIDGCVVRFSWNGMQPAIGSVRKLAEKKRATSGDLLFIELTETAQSGSSYIIRHPDVILDPIKKLCAMCGISETAKSRNEALKLLARAIGMPSTAPTIELLRLHFEARRDAEAVALLQEQRHNGNGETLAILPRLLAQLDQ